MNKETRNFGLKEVDYTPMGSINMEGNFFRGIADPQRKRSLFMRVMSIIIALFIFIFPSMILLYVGTLTMIASFSDSSSLKLILMVVQAFLFILIILWFIIGLKIFFVNLKKRS